MIELYRLRVAVGLLVLSAGSAFAQQTPPQPPPDSPPPVQDPYPGRTVEPPPGVLVAGPPPRDEPWSFTLGINGAYEGNVLFIAPTSEDTEFSNTVQASIGRAWRLPRGDAQLAATASQAFYQDTTSLNDFRYSVFGGLGHMITRRLTWSGNVSLSSGLARDSQILTDAGAVLPSTTSALTSMGSSLFSYALSPKSNISWSVGTYGVGFSSVAFNGGANLTTAGTYSRHVGLSQTIGATVDYSRTFTEGLSSNVYGVLGSWAFAARHGWVVSVSGGVRPYTVPSEEGLRVSGAFYAALTKPVRRNQTVGVAYSDGIEQAYGLNTVNNLVQTVTANYGIGLRRNLSAMFGGSYSLAKDPVVPQRSVTGAVAQGSLGYRIKKNLSLSVGSSFYSRENQSAKRVTSTSTYVALAYHTTW